MEWELKNYVVASNPNLKNTLKLSKKYRIDIRRHNIEITQNLSESTIGLDIPCYLLDLWDSYFKDSGSALIEAFTIIKAESINQTNYNNDTEFVTLAISSLINKLAEYEGFFSKYRKKTRAYAERSEKFKKSSLKDLDDFKFIPVNLHLEQFDVVSRFDGLAEKKNSYDFTSVGAFTTVHQNKPEPQMTVVNLMKSESLSLKEPSHILKHEVTLVFFSLKIFIYLLNDLVLISKTEEKVQPILRCTKHLDIIHRVIIPSYQAIKVSYLSNTDRMGLTADSLEDKFKYLKVKFIELSEKVKQTEFQNLADFMFKVIEPIVELYNLVFTETISEKIRFINQCAIFTHAVTTLVASLDMKYKNNDKVPDQELESLFNYHMKNGILFQVESMLSCSSNEADMLQEHYKAIQGLMNVHLHFPLQYTDLKNKNDESIFVVLRSDGYHVYFYSNVESGSRPIRVYPLLFNVGINEQATITNFFGNNLLQKYVNSNSIINLRNYYDNIRNSFQEVETKNQLDALVKRLEINKSFVEDSRPVELLHIVAQITRLIGGFRVTNCKSGKDRTGVGVSLEQSFILVRHHDLDNSLLQYVLDDIRRNGTRIEILKKNVGKGVYAFNKLRYFLLPPLYQPPIDLCSDYIET